MTKKTPPMLDEHVDFKALFNDVKPVTHDKYVPSRKEKQGLKRNKQKHTTGC